ncbi:MAG: hypothetical protein L0G99_06500 [Propionibacteriales bacterium]|nr:hypothetical protein [Propionibacteriales bacterium]
MSASDKAAIRAWWARLPSEHFIALSPPTRNRYTQSDGHGDVVELLKRTRRARDTAYAFWHWQSHERSFDSRGVLVSPLYLQWGGNEAVVRRALGAGPAGYEVTGGGEGLAFVLDRISLRDGDGLPAPDDEVGVRQLLAELSEPISRRHVDFEYPPLTDPQRVWLHARLAQERPLIDVGHVIEVLELRDDVTSAEADRWGQLWWDADPDLTTFPAWRFLLVALLRTGNELGWAAVERIGPRALSAVGQVPSDRSESVLLAAARSGVVEAMDPWLRTRIAWEGDPTEAALSLAIDLDDHQPTAEQWQELSNTFMQEQGRHMRERGVEVALPSRTHLLPVALDERFPDGLRRVFARKTSETKAALAESMAVLDDQTEVYRGYRVTDAQADLARFDEETTGLLRVSGPVLTGYEGGLVREWNNYRTLTDGDIEWLHAQVADPATELQGIGFCLELLYAHGQGSAADVDALAPRWRKVLAKSYQTTYTEWRHPLVTLTCLARELDHPLAEKLLTWWEKTPPAWKEPLKLLTALGDATPDAADALIQFVGEGGHDTGHLRTWALTMARIHGWDEPMLVIDALITKDFLGKHPETLIPHLIALVDPAQPLWHYRVGDTLHWWDRIVEAAEHPELSEESRALVVGAAGRHRIISHPDDMNPRPSAATKRAAQRWYAEAVG